MHNPHDKWRGSAIKLLVFLPIVALSCNVIAWLRYGIDLPFFDDWADYASQNVGSFAWNHLFQSYNDTLFPVGKFLDAVAQNLLNGNTLAYQFLSMIFVLGGLLLLQWRLLVIALSDRLLAACAFSLTLFMLMPGSYWGLQNLAYIQALPLLFLLMAIYVIFGKDWHTSWNVWSVFILGILAGFSYTSGAFAVLTVAAVLLFASRFIQHSERAPLQKGGLSLLLAGIMTVIPQLWVLVIVQKGLHTSTQLGLPTEGVFWMYLLGKVGRALMPLPYYPVFSLIVVSLVVLLTVFLLCLCIRWLIKNEMRSLAEVRVPIIYIAFCSFIFIYLCMISAGRVHLVPADTKASLIDTFTFGFHRSHYFWVTLLWPWLLAAGCVAAIKLNLLQIKSMAKGWTFGLIGLTVALTSSILVGNGLLYRIYTQTFYKKHVACLLSEIQKGKGIHCPTLYPADLTPAFMYARQKDASFMGYFPIMPIPMGTETPKPLFRSSKTVQTEEFAFKTKMPKALKSCMILDVNALVQVGQDNAIQLVYAIPDSEKKGETRLAVSKPLSLYAKQAALTELVFQIDSVAGFLDNFQLKAARQIQRIDNISSFRDALRLNKALEPQPFFLKGLEVRCRLSSNVEHN